MKLTSISTALRRTASAALRSVGGPQTPSPVRRMAPKPRRWTESSPPKQTSPAKLAETLFSLLFKTISFQAACGEFFALHNIHLLHSILVQRCADFGGKSLNIFSTPLSRSFSFFSALSESVSSTLLRQMSCFVFPSYRSTTSVPSL